MGRIYINAIRVINNIKTFGWRNTCAKLKKYLHLGSSSCVIRYMVNY